MLVRLGLFAFGFVPALAWAQLAPPLMVVPSPNQPVIVQSSPPVIVLPPPPLELPQQAARPWYARPSVQAYDGELPFEARLRPARAWNAGAAFGGALLGLLADGGVTSLVALAILSQPSRDWDFTPIHEAGIAVGIGLFLAPLAMGAMASVLGGDGGGALGLAILGAVLGVAATAGLVYAMAEAGDGNAAAVTGVLGALVLAPAAAAGGFALGASRRDRNVQFSLAPSPNGAMMSLGGTF